MAKTWDCVNAYVAPSVRGLIETTSAPGCFGAPCYAAVRPVRRAYRKLSAFLEAIACFRVRRWQKF